MILKNADDRANDVAELKRLRASSPRRYHAAIQKQIDNIYTGVAGEREAAHFLNRAFGRSENVAVLHDLRLGVDGEFVQIDHVVIHRVRQTISQSMPLVISTAYGEVTITRIPDGRHTLRNQKNDALIKLVKTACRGKARWNPRFRNWLIQGSDLEGILAALKELPEARSRSNTQ